MRVLVSNDDGVDAPGILMLARQLASIGDVVVVAPDRDRSGASNSLTLDLPIRLKRIDHIASCHSTAATVCGQQSLTEGGLPPPPNDSCQHTLPLVRLVCW